MKKVLVALVGNPNVGKTSLLNHIAGTTLRVGNWPGVTVEKREGKIFYGDYEITFVDLPGIYTLEPVSEDEQIAYHFLKEEKVDLIINVIEAPNMERDLFLTAQLMELGKPMVIALNMWDEALRLGIDIDTSRMQELLGLPVVKTNGRKGEGVKDLLEAVVRAIESDLRPFPLPYLRTPLQDQELRDRRLGFAHGLYTEVVKRRSTVSQDITEALDRIVLHPVMGPVFFVFVMFLLFKVAFDVSSPFMDWLDGFFQNFLGPLVKRYVGNGFWGSFLSEAVVGGVGFVLTFVPLIASLFFLLSFLEFSGYIPRVAFLTDRFMHRIGLHGKGVIPLLLGFGCNVPAVLATRTLDTKRDKMLVLAMIPFMSCPARLVVFSFFATLFFPSPVLVMLGLYLMGVMTAIVTGFVLKKLVYTGSLTHFVMELPPYRLPTLKLLLRITWVHVKDFLYRAGTLILAVAVVVWSLLHLPVGVSKVEDSVAAHIGKVLLPIFEPMGIHDWRITTSLIPAFMAREVVLGSMATIYAVEEESRELEDPWKALEEQGVALLSAFKEAGRNLLSPVPKVFEVKEEHSPLRQAVSRVMDPPTALAFMVFMLLYMSCLGTFSVLKREAGGRFALLFLAYSFLIAWMAGVGIYRLWSILLSL
ncbi:ferrous iron transport protein B [Thermocrinis albus DSM 14484]|uniref:Ferrous iron transport protein B n=1 Tax=Thermocrinis albus (strain DSM 14484 / JCM 11386 / HI 11/12) TaxID=638303 RepID=D3SNX5_THEAH|nr:ferrous iron transport protein B [Thermocrinis albus]ADC88862.1 ferrous iron transport protein B [Thermocrinis albus DSM 14484]